MKKVLLAIMLLATLASKTQAQTTDDIELKNGSVLVYNITEGAKKYNYTVTYTILPTEEIQLSWQTNETPKAKKGTSTIIKYYTLYSKEILIGGNTIQDEKLNREQIRILIPQTLDNYIAETEEDATQTFTINENGKQLTYAIENVTINDYQSKKVTYNSQLVNAKYDEVLIKDGNRTMGMFQNHDNYQRFLAYYKSDAITMELASITTPISKVQLKPVVEKGVTTKPVPTTPQKMDATKFKAVAKAFPLLAKVENYDPTKGGTIKKPFTETYDFRLSSGATNPPSAIDCFTADLQIIYNQKKNFGLDTLVESKGKNQLSKNVAAALINVYVKTAARSTPGYKPFTHNSFVNSLTIQQRQQLATELEGYIKKYGFTE
jgi:hypothetical protein